MLCEKSNCSDFKKNVQGLNGMSTPLKNRVMSISSEVDELHPLIEKIFRQMPSIIKVEYTHGVNEKGADFILTKKSEELGDTEYIGVIAKIGKITQNITSINNQIEECVLRRIACNGKKEIFLSEIWVVANGSISDNAREKIYDKYKTSKIKFVDINTLNDLAEKYFQDYGIDIPVSDANYLVIQKEICVQREQKFSLLPPDLNDKSIPLEIEKVDDDYASKNKIIDIYKFIESERFASIESQMGGGKTRLLNNLVCHFSDLDVYSEKRIIPIYISSGEIFQHSKTLSEIVDEKTKGFNLKEDSRRQYLILVDGIDEVKNEEDNASQRLVALIDEASNSDSIKLIIASRNICNELVESNDVFRRNRCRIKTLQLKMIVDYLQQVCVSLNFKKRLIEDLKKSELFKVLPKTPIATIILAKLFAEGNEELPMNMTELYAKYCELSLGRWDVDKGLQTQKQFKALDALISIIAKYMLDNELPSLSKQEAKEIFDDYLLERNLQLDSRELLQNMLERSGILVEDQEGNKIRFKHRSFAEFFYAKKLQAQQSIKIDVNVFHPYWSNSYYFYIGLMRDCPDLLTQIIDYPIMHEGHRISRIVNLAGFLLAGYQTPYNIIKKGIESVFVDIGNYYHEVSEKKTDSFLGRIPPIHLLALLNNVMDQNYNYKYFEGAIVEVLEDYATKPVVIDGLPYTIFFLDTIRFKLGSDILFDNLVEIYGTELPTVLQLAIGHESKRLDHVSPAIKKTQKRIMKHRRTSRRFDSEITKLYSESING